MAAVVLGTGSRCYKSFSSITKMLCHFQYKSRLSVRNLQRIQDWRQMIIKLYVDNSANDSNDTTLDSGFTRLGCWLRCIAPT